LIRIALLAGALGLLVAPLPSASVGQWAAMVFGLTAVVLGGLARRQALGQGLTGAVASAAVALALLALLVGTVGFVACQSPSTAGRQERPGPELRRRIEGAALRPAQPEVGAEVDVDR
jgi:hypothetical protein